MNLSSICSFFFKEDRWYIRSSLSVEENFMSNSYTAWAHKRTVMVLFEKNGKQDLWFLTINENATWKKSAKIAYAETRFIIYDTLHIFNLDGGSSVAHVNRAHPELNIGIIKILPYSFWYSIIFLLCFSPESSWRIRSSKKIHPCRMGWGDSATGS